MIGHPLSLLLLASLITLGMGGCLCPAEPPATEDSDDEPITEDDPEGSEDQGNANIHNFRASKRMLPELFENHARTFYCDCPFNGKKVSFKGCGYKVRKNSSRAKRLEWEHVVPAAAFGRSLKPWAEGHPNCKNSKKRPYKGRRCAEKMSKRFRRMEADLYNLRPAIGEVNGDRSDKKVGLISGEPRLYGSCDVEITKDTVEPHEGIRGEVARTYLYMDWAYPGTLNLTAEEETMFKAWSDEDPPDAWELEWADQVEELQGNRNPFIKE